jgi:hypothetical protein
MTDAERTTLEQQISEGLVQLGYFQVWRPADACPQGHPNQDPETDAPLADVGELCGECVSEWQDRQVTDPAAIRALAMVMMARGEWEDPPDTVRDDPMALANYIVTKAVLCHDQDPNWHPEWRIGRAPKPWSRSLDCLVPFVEAWRLQATSRHPGRKWSILSPLDRSPAEGIVWVGDMKFMRQADTPAEALALAFAAALAAQEGEV